MISVGGGALGFRDVAADYIIKEEPDGRHVYRGEEGAALLLVFTPLANDAVGVVRFKRGDLLSDSVAVVLSGRADKPERNTASSRIRGAVSYKGIGVLRK